jgi:hypothetical protein
MLCINQPGFEIFVIKYPEAKERSKAHLIKKICVNPENNMTNTKINLNIFDLLSSNGHDRKSNQPTNNPTKKIKNPPTTPGTNKPTNKNESIRSGTNHFGQLLILSKRGVLKISIFLRSLL